MRTTLDIDNDVLEAAKEIARQQNLAVGKVISKLAHDALRGLALSGSGGESGVSGFRPFPARERLVTNTQIDALRDSEGV